jgi:tetratricopeptide (TPR) repeat protein
VLDVYDAIHRLEGGQEARAMLVETARHYLQSLAVDAGEDHTLIAELASAWQRLGDVQGEVDAASLGAVEDAADSYEHALALQLRLAVLRPGDAEVLREIGVLHTRLGDLAYAAGDADGALHYFRRAAELTWEVISHHPASASARRNLGICHDKIGRALLRLGRVQPALAHERLSLAMCEARALAEPSDVQARRDLAANTQHLGDFLLAARDPALLREVDALHERSFCLAESLVLEDPHNAEVQRTFALAQLRLGDLAARRGDPQGMLDAWRRSATGLAQLVSADPGDATARHDLNLVRIKIAVGLKQQGDLTGALAELEAARLLCRERVERLPGHAGAQRDLAVNHFQVAEVLEALAQDEARPAHERAMQLERAAKAYSECLALNRDMDDRGVLRASDAPLLTLLPARIERCREAAAPSDASSSP